MINIREMKSLFNKHLELNKRIVDDQAIAVVPGLFTANKPINDVDVEEDYIYFCFTKFTKTMVGFLEDTVKWLTKEMSSTTNEILKELQNDQIVSLEVLMNEMKN